MGKALFSVKDVDRHFYEERLKDFMPVEVVDFHTHVWRQELAQPWGKARERTVTWPSRVATENPIEDLLETYRLMFPDKKVTPLIFTTLDMNMERANEYVSECSRQHGCPALIFSHPEWSGQELEKRIRVGEFLGAKSYLSLAPAYLPTGEIRVFDFFPHHQLEVLDENRWIMMLHIPRTLRLKDPVNLAQLCEIDKRYPHLQMVVAHVGRAYCPEDVGDAFEVLKDTEHLVLDISANTNSWVFEQAIRALGPSRILFGSDLPITRMRMRRICRDGIYVNLVPRGMYGDVSGDKNMGEVDGEEAERLTFFLYEEIDAFRRAADSCGLAREDIQRVFCDNARRTIHAAQSGTVAHA